MCRRREVAVCFILCCSRRLQKVVGPLVHGSMTGQNGLPIICPWIASAHANDKRKTLTVTKVVPISNATVPKIRLVSSLKSMSAREHVGRYLHHGIAIGQSYRCQGHATQSILLQIIHPGLKKDQVKVTRLLFETR